ncbi:hypothetical protein R1flu_014345 [Riccia fluitans]|uniref:Formyl transferase C-terminal domain-containing protein n=1 Tax=Riccia fluitans TaxID=41844 RepID=A0ABD1YFV0_9MARC
MTERKPTPRPSSGTARGASLNDRTGVLLSSKPSRSLMPDRYGPLSNSLYRSTHDITKSSIYCGPVTRATLTATLAAIERIQTASIQAASPYTPPPSPGSQKFAPHLVTPLIQAKPAYRDASVTLQKTFLGGVTRHCPLLKAAQRDFDIQSHTAREISRRIRSSDSQPGCLTTLFGLALYVYGGIIEESDEFVGQAPPRGIVACRDDAVCVATCDEKAIWITHVRRIKKKKDPMLFGLSTLACAC